MRCPQCKSKNSRVVESRDVEDAGAIRRRRECESCTHRFTTYERLELPRLLIIKKNGERELYSRDKLAAGIYRACEKRPVDSERIEKLLSEIERELYSLGEAEITSGEVGELVMRGLAELDDVAYVRFASVYRSFTSIESFEKALQQIKRHRKN
ncbi:MAG: transcriptional repressor NrdR [Patescibacteria group bacterium]|nr:transcriptional repressor NrdR [Patescibacteria group bacterium]